MRRIICTILFLVVSLSLCACEPPWKTEETAVYDGPAPILTDSVDGYGGFQYLSPYTIEQSGSSFTVYLPADENVYIGNSAIISKKEGIQCTFYFNPLFSDKAGNTLKQRLQYILDTQYSDIYTKDYKNVIVSDVKSTGENAASAQVSYLRYSEDIRTYLPDWIQYDLLSLGDGNFCEIELRVIPEEVTENTEDLIEELENYFQYNIGYDADALNEMASSYDPDEEDSLRMAGEKIEIGSLVFSMPDGWVKNDFFTELFEEEYYSYGDAKLTRLNDDGVLVYGSVASEFSAGNLYTLTDREKTMMQDFMTEYAKESFKDADLSTEVIGVTDLGFEVVFYGENFKAVEVSGKAKVKMYMIYRGNNLYCFGAVGKEGDELAFDHLEDIYKSLKGK